MPKPLVWAFPSGKEPASREWLEGGTQGQTTTSQSALVPEREPWEPQRAQAGRHPIGRPLPTLSSAGLGATAPVTGAPCAGPGAKENTGCR